MRNAVGEKRTLLKMSLGNLNVGGSHISTSGDFTHTNITAVLLNDIVDSMAQEGHQKSIEAVMKVDIESYECKAFLGSPDVFNRGVCFRFIIMEWYFKGRMGSCTKGELKSMTEMFSTNGYLPYRLKKRKELNLKSSQIWLPGDVVWVHTSVQSFMW